MTKVQNAPRSIASVEQIADALLNGSYDFVSFPEIVVSGLTKQVLQEILDRVRTLQQRTIAAEVRADHINMRKPDRKINVEKEARISLKTFDGTSIAERCAYIEGFEACAKLIQGHDDNLPQ